MDILRAKPNSSAMLNGMSPWAENRPCRLSALVTESDQRY